MASDSSQTTTIPSFSIPIAEKLTKSNYRLQRAQILPSIRAAQLKDFLTATDEMLAKTVVSRLVTLSLRLPTPSIVTGLLETKPCFDISSRR
jgi:hypothetical protein